MLWICAAKELEVARNILSGVSLVSLMYPSPFVFAKVPPITKRLVSTPATCDAVSPVSCEPFAVGCSAVAPAAAPAACDSASACALVAAMPYADVANCAALVRAAR